MFGRHICPLCPRETRVEGAACDLCRSKKRLEREKLPKLPLNTKCFYCKREAAGLDHVIPLNRNGDDRPRNLVPACIRCNSSKADRLPSEWCPKNKRAVALEMELRQEIQVLGHARGQGFKTKGIGGWPREKHIEAAAFLRAIIADVDALDTDITSSFRVTDPPSPAGRRALERLRSLRYALNTMWCRQFGKTEPSPYE